MATMRAGSTRLWLEEAQLASALAVAGAPDGLRSALRVIERARAGDPSDPVLQVIGRPGDRKPLVMDGSWLYAERMYVLEERFSARIRERLAQPPALRDPRALRKAVAAVTGGPPPLTDEQKRAVQQALASSVALISGAPGTGKTTIVVALVRALAWLGERLDGIAVAAPTGKAAQRLQESLRAGLTGAARDMADVALAQAVPPPQTLHRLLGFSPHTGRFAHHENNRMPYRVVVVDEASMVDLAMMDRLVRALRPDARLVLLGDADQLPSVEAGAVFRDLCSALGAVRLTVNLRVAREPSARRIVAAAGAVNAGRIDHVFAEAVATRASVSELRFEGVEHLAVSWEQAGEAVLDAWWQMRFASVEGFPARATRTFRAHGDGIDPAENAELGALFDLYARSRVLCATRAAGLATSVEAINDRMIARLNGGRSRVSRWRRSPRPSAGAPLVVERNDYERQLYNGDPGIVVRSGDGESAALRAVFRRESSAGESFEAHPLDALADVSPGFAMTVHKAQGSEFDHVLVVLPERDLPLVTRELVYTAITRARRSVLLVGHTELLARAVSRIVERYCGIAEKLRRSAQ
jgi:exodeoxyribonuclease V alpha subunit